MTAWQVSLKISGDRMVKAIEKRTKQLREERTLQLTKQHVQTAQKVGGDVAASHVTTTITNTDKVITNTTTEFSEQYQNTIVTNMVALIKQRKMK